MVPADRDSLTAGPRAVNRRYCAIVPALNAGKTIGGLVRQARAQGVDVVVVDDGSTDRTAAAAAAEGALVISHLRNHGKGRALRTGFEHALRARYDGVVTLDGDGQHDSAEIPALIRAGEVQHAGLVLGNRMGDGLAMPWVRRGTNRLMSGILSRLAQQDIPDSQCGFRFIRRELLEQLPLRSSRFEIESEVLLWAAAHRWKIVSVPVASIYRDHASHIRPVRDGLRFLVLLARFWLARAGRPGDQAGS